MDAIYLKAGIHGIAAPPISASGNVELWPSEKPSISAAQPRNSPWGFTFRHPLRSLWPGGKNRYEPAISVDDTVLVEEREDIKEDWVLKILHVKSLWKEEEVTDGELVEEENEECDDGMCVINDDGKNIEFDRESFSKLLKKVPLAEARLYAKMSYLGSLAYSISQIKLGNLLRHYGLRFVTSSLEKKEQASKLEEEKVLFTEDQQNETKKAEAEANEKRVISAKAAYHIAASAASYLHSHTKSLIPFKSSKSTPNENELNGGIQDVASLMATTDSVTSVVAAKEEVKQAVADDLNSILSSPCEWFVCDDDQSATRFFVIQGSESLASWQANLLFEPIQFEGLDILVHRGIYEAAKGIYEQMLPEIHAHLKSHGNHAKFRFTGHSLGGSLSVLVNLMFLIRNEAPRSSLLPVITFGAPSIMCGGDRLLRVLGLPRNHVRSITLHRDIVPRAFSCNYPNHVAEFLKAVNGNFRSHPCLNKQKLLYAPMGEFLILQPDDKFSPNHELLPSGSGLYILTCPNSDTSKSEKQIREAQAVFLNSPHPLEILSDPSAYGSEGTIQRDHDMNSYLKSVRNVIRQEIIRIRKEHRRNIWWAPSRVDAGLIVGGLMGRGRVDFSGVIRTGGESLKRFSTLVASQHMHLLLVLLLPARLLHG
ncbi:hypothetical protein RD792_009285 [Penstemon davidsonii]|uniref:Fungal lipase-type domain-containing protein n=1 Tax=Penstemon davidsonii TaxID=160366 RepID=A0ABR0CZE2_9LAMI|nr:hypothetical protein RD792_009285 [Penstemon davidsonii]